MRHPARSTSGLVMVAAGVVACSAAAPGGSAGSRAQPTPAPPPASTAAPSASPSVADPGARTPVALVVHRSRGPVDVPLGTARAVLAGQVEDWAQFGEDAAPLRLLSPSGADLAEGAVGSTAMSAADVVLEVSRDPRAIGVVPGHAVTPLVRSVLVDGVDPVRSPDRYPLTTAGAAPPQVVTLTVVGDLMLGRRVGAAMAASGDFAAPLRPTAARLAAADVTLGNFEATLSQNGAPTQGGDSFAADPRTARGLRLAGFDVLSLANNHVGDWGSRALVETVQAVRDIGVLPVGAGLDRAQARRPALLDVRGIRVGVIATDSIGESPAAGLARPGTNRIDAPPRTGPLDRTALERVAGDVRRLAAQADVVVVMTHWGTQYTHRPERSQRVIGRALVEAGADIVVGGHPHWVQGVEVVDPDRGAVIVHSLGNFVFDMDFMRRTQEGVLLEVVTWGGELKAVEPVPYVIGDDFAPRVVRGARATSVLAPFRAGSDPPFDRG